MCYGLSKTYRGELLEGSKCLFEVADQYREIKTTCFFCNKKATHNARYYKGKQIRDGEDIVATDDFCLPVCRKHYKEADNQILKRLINREP